MRRLVHLALAAGLLGTCLVVAPAGAAPTSSCQRTERGYTCLYGPVDVPAGEMVDITTSVTPPGEAGYITSARATLVDAEGGRIAHHMVHLHHAVWINPARNDMTCSSFGPYPNVDRFFGSGKERTKMVIPDGYGYHWDGSAAYGQPAPWWALVAHLDGMHGQNDTYIRLNLGFIPEADAVVAGVIDVSPVWLDVENCSVDPVFDIRKGSGRNDRFRKSWTYVMPQGGDFVSMGGHLHDGGLKLVLRNKTTSSEVFTSVATYGKSRKPWYLTKMSAFSEAPGRAVAAGDELKLTAVYDSTHTWRDAMGIMVGYLAP